MKPLRLIMRAFGPFPGEEVVDFRELGHQPFFLIHGATGSGKTTILDAICLALYGDDASLTRKGSGFRSDYADPRTATEVVFDFALGEDRYRIQRTPQHQRPKLRGEGLRTIPAEATLWRRTDTQDDIQEGELLATQSKNVTPRIQELIGFKCAQFRQVVVLPQGEFRKLLLANSTDREAILERLFDVDLYRRIQEALKKEFNQVNETGLRLKELKNEILRQCEVEQESDFAAKVEEVRTATQRASAELEKLQKSADEKRTAFEKARSDAEKLKEVTLAESAYEKSKSQKSHFASDRKILEAARNAQALVEVKTHLDQRGDEQREVERQKTEACEQLAVAAATQKDAKLSLEVELANETRREAARAEVLRLTEFRQRAKELASLKSELAEAETLLTNHKDIFTKTQKESQQTKETLESKHQQREGLAEVANSYAAKEQAQAETQAQLKKWEALCQWEEQAKASALSVKSAEKAVKERSKLLTKARQREMSLREAWQAGQASLLARELQPEQPCPVCGSAEHPHPAQETEKTPSKDSLDSQRSTLEALEEDLEQARDFAQTTQQAHVVLQTQIDSLVRELSCQGKKNFADTLQKELGQRQLQLEQAREAREQHQHLGEELETLSKRQKTLDAELATHQMKLSQAESSQSEVQGRHKERLAALPEAIRAPGALEEALGAATTLRDKLEQTLLAQRETSAKADQAFAEATSSVKSTEKAEKHSAKRLQRQRDTFLAALAKAKFSDEAAFLSSVRDDAEINRLDQSLREGEQELSAAKDRHTRAVQAASGLAAVDVTALEEGRQKAQAAFEQATQEKGALDEKSNHLATLYQRFQGFEEELKQLRTRYLSLGDIAEKANGTNSLRLTFQRFVLAAFLDNVLELASVSLQKMSKGRYHLRRADESQDKRSAGGLDLVVFDAQTGVERPVSTLSGGESFLASLALALGLAEVVQHYAGGIKLDAIFIDEGFGTLDADALDLAISTLLELRQGGRMVGVISHVAELRERIQTRLEIVATRQGSTTQFHLP